MDRVIKIKNETTTIEETIKTEESIKYIRDKLKDKENINLNKQRLIFKIEEL